MKTFKDLPAPQNEIELQGRLHTISQFIGVNPHTSKEQLIERFGLTVQLEKITQGGLGKFELTYQGGHVMHFWDEPSKWLVV